MDENNPKGTGTGYIDVAMVLLVVVVMLMAISSATRPLAIGLGAFVPAGIGVVVLLVAGIDMFMKRGSGTGDSDFSSFYPTEERAFVTHEKTMRANSSRASFVGFGIAGVLFVLGMIITLGLYSPCTNFCDHAPGSCKTDAAVASWRAGCESACGRLENTPGLSILKSRPNEDSKNATMQPVAGTEYVSTLSACAFSGGNGAVCEEVVKRATSMGLWCPETN
jgi:hypothetical protein